MDNQDMPMAYKTGSDNAYAIYLKKHTA